MCSENAVIFQGFVCWCREFERSHMGVTSTAQYVDAAIRVSGGVKVWEFSTELRMSYGFVFDNVRDLHQYLKVSTRWVSMWLAYTQIGAARMLSYGSGPVRCRGNTIHEQDYYAHDHYTPKSK